MIGFVGGSVPVLRRGSLLPSRRSMSAVAIAVACVAAAGSLEAAVARAAFPGRNGLIAYTRTVVSGASRGSYVFVVGSDGRHRKRLTTSGHDANPSISRDGRKIVFEHGNFDLDQSEIWEMNVDGSHARRLTHDGGNTAPAFAPSGRAIVFSHETVDRRSSIVSMRLSNGHRRTLANDGENPSYSPRGDRVVFQGTGDSNPNDDQILIINADGSHQLALTHPPGERSVSPSFSPNGRAIVFANTFPSHGEFPTRLVLIRTNGTGRRVLTAPGRFSEPSFAPNGKAIVFVRTTLVAGSDLAQLRIMRSNGSHQHALLHDSADDTAPNWGPTQPKKHR